MMLWALWLGIVASLLGTATADVSAVYQDPDTGLTFSQSFALYKSDGRGITFRVAIPASAATYTAFDTVIQVVVPNDVGWGGLAWAGSMTRNPLLVFWRGSNNAPVISSRWANGHSTPTSYTGASYTLYKTGTKSNSTHWQFTAICQGCTSWAGDGGAIRYLSPRGGNRLAFAYSPTKPSSSSNTSTIAVHEVHGYWTHDFSAAANSNYDAAVEKFQK
ncbi:hypothetical protein B0H66DRAFT_92352 [Apodospora peruviana]|uniref:Cellobiose dehydrogenase-like cytochrome domain-containing protein n=1 Tax=Apodospora peruviana TaxID=516989 RepID=A0AAE0MGT0_9PEZI|nr:hypothetical protein B0H66DRAFT_92352 [Apodospora peruviana]